MSLPTLELKIKKLTITDGTDGVSMQVVLEVKNRPNLYPLVGLPLWAVLRYDRPTEGEQIPLPGTNGAATPAAWYCSACLTTHTGRCPQRSGDPLATGADDDDEPEPAPDAPCRACQHVSRWHGVDDVADRQICAVDGCPCDDFDAADDVDAEEAAAAAAARDALAQAPAAVVLVGGSEAAAWADRAGTLARSGGVE